MTGALVLSINRRKHHRYPISLKLNYKTKSAGSGTGEVADIGSGGIFFQTHYLLPVGQRIEAAMTWPFLLDGHCHLQLCIRGSILRSDALGTAVAIERYEFRTAGTLVADHEVAAALAQ